MLINASAVLLDGSIPLSGDALAQAEQRIHVPRATDCTIRVTFKKQDGSALDLTLGSVALGVRYNASDVDPIFVRPGVVVGSPTAGVADFLIVQADTINFFPSGFFWDVFYTDPSGARSQVVHYSPFVLDAVAALPTDPLTSPTPSLILIGPIPDRTGNNGKVLGLVAGLLTWVPGGGGGGSVASVTATDSSIVVDNTDAANPKIALGVVSFAKAKAALAAATSDVGFNGQRLSSVADPTGPTDAATGGWVLAQIAGVSVNFTNVKAALAAATSDVGFNAWGLTGISHADLKIDDLQAMTPLGSGVNLKNTTPTTAGIPLQDSPIVEFYGRQWNPSNTDGPGDPKDEDFSWALQARGVVDDRRRGTLAFMARGSATLGGGGTYAQMFSMRDLGGGLAGIYWGVNGDYIFSGGGAGFGFAPGGSQRLGLGDSYFYPITDNQYNLGFPATGRFKNYYGIDGTFQHDGIGDAIASGQGVKVFNTTPTTLGSPIQRSPLIELHGRQWNPSNIGTEDQDIAWALQVIGTNDERRAGRLAFMRYGQGYAAFQEYASLADGSGGLGLLRLGGPGGDSIAGGNTSFAFFLGGAGRFSMNNTAFGPYDDNARKLGYLATNRWSDAYCVNYHVAATPGVGGGVGVIAVGNAATAPTSNPTAGTLIYVDPADGVLKARGASGTITPLALP